MFIDLVLFVMAIFAYMTLANQSLIQALKKDRALWQYSNWSYFIDIIIILALWLPLEFGIVKFGITKYLLGTYTGTVSAAMLSFYTALYKLLALIMALNWFLIVRQFPMDFRLSARNSDWNPAIKHFLALAPILIVIGVATNFTAFIGFAKINLLALLVPFIILYAVAIPEELLFRGMIQHITEHFFGKKIGLALAAIIFGLAHANSGDLRYVILATIAGYGYGLVYQKTKSIFPAALVHAGADIVWVLFFYTATPKG